VLSGCRRRQWTLTAWLVQTACLVTSSITLTTRLHTYAGRQCSGEPHHDARPLPSLSSPDTVKRVGLHGVRCIGLLTWRPVCCWQARKWKKHGAPPQRKTFISWCTAKDIGKAAKKYLLHNCMNRRTIRDLHDQQFIFILISMAVFKSIITATQAALADKYFMHKKQRQLIEKVDDWFSSVISELSKRGGRKLASCAHGSVKFWVKAAHSDCIHVSHAPASSEEDVGKTYTATSANETLPLAFCRQMKTVFETLISDTQRGTAVGRGIVAWQRGWRQIVGSCSKVSNVSDAKRDLLPRQRRPVSQRHVAEQVGDGFTVVCSSDSFGKDRRDVDRLREQNVGGQFWILPELDQAQEIWESRSSAGRQSPKSSEHLAILIAKIAVFHPKHLSKVFRLYAKTKRCFLPNPRKHSLSFLKEKLLACHDHVTKRSRSTQVKLTFQKCRCQIQKRCETQPKHIRMSCKNSSPANSRKHTPSFSCNARQLIWLKSRVEKVNPSRTSTGAGQT